MANRLTIMRMLLSVVLLFLSPLSFVFWIIYTACGITDMLDGYVARKTNTVSQFGSKLDSIADLIFICAAMIQILPIVKIDFWMWIWIALIAFVKLLNLICGYIVQHAMVMLHTKANKVAGFLLFLLPIILLFAELKYIAVLVLAVASFAAVQEGHIIRTGGNRHEQI